MRGRRGVDFFLHAHAATVRRAVPGTLGLAPASRLRLAPRNPGTQEPRNPGPRNPGTQAPRTQEPRNPGTQEPRHPGTRNHDPFGISIVCWHTRGVSEILDPETSERTGRLDSPPPAPRPAEASQPAGRDEPCVLLKLGEIVLKGRNRQQFERLLHGNIRRALRDLGLPVDCGSARGSIVLRVAEASARRGRLRPGRCPDRRADGRRHGHVPGLPRGAGGQGPGGGRRRRGDADRGPPGHVRGPGPAPGQALPGHLGPARHADRRPRSSRRTASRSTCPARTPRSSSRSTRTRCSCSPRGCPGRAGCRSG